MFFNFTIHAAKASRKRTMNRMLSDMLGRVFEGSAQLLVAHLLEEANPTSEELAEIRRVISQYEQHSKTGK